MGFPNKKKDQVPAKARRLLGIAKQHLYYLADIIADEGCAADMRRQADIAATIRIADQIAALLAETRPR